MTVIYKKMVNYNDVEKLQKNLDRLTEWTVENIMKTNPGKCNAVRFRKARMKDQLNYSPLEYESPEARSCKYLGIILRRYLA